ncbi:MAG: polysaccharide deacetylase family protein [Ardenticatenaceae bacterium]|nr:polysaccharide deacetylase family protein [Ardenticatenaceae bacterium]
MNIKARKILKSIRRRSISTTVDTITHVKTTAPVAALTFDDGPHPNYTPALLNILDQYKAKATFFMVGEAAERHKDLVEKVKAAGHTVGNHSWSHPSFIEIDRKKRQEEVRRTEKALNLNGVRLFRPPHGHQNLASRLDLFRLDYKVICWNVTAQDWLEQTPDEMVNQLIGNIRPGSIILLHDAIYRSRLPKPQFNREPMLEALDITLHKLSQQFDFVTVPDLLQYGRPVYTYWNRSD